MSRTVVFGDVHGMLPELQALLGLVGLTAGDHLVSAGDLLDKGPDSAGVVRFLRGLRDAGQPFTLVLGNHEEKHVRYRKAAAGGAVPKMKGVEELEAITQALSPEDVAFLDAAVPFFRMPEHKALVVHAGVLPSTEIPTMDEYAAMSKGEREKLLRILRVRHLTAKPKVTVTVEYTYDHDPGDSPDISYMSREVLRKTMRPAGDFVSLGQEGPEDPFWAQQYDGRFGHIYFGHSPFPTASEPKQFPHATGLDLGCVFGGRLAAVVLEVGKDPVFYSVPARGKFAVSFAED